MNTPDWTYDLHISGTDPKRMPMDALADVLRRLAELMGSPEHLRFKRLRGGSAAVLVKVEETAQQVVHARLIGAKLVGQEQDTKAQRLNEALGSRGWSAELRRHDGAVILDFPGRRSPQPVPEQTVRQHDTMLGTVIQIGGKDETVPMTLQLPGGEYVHLTVKGRELARRLAKVIFDKEVRVYGTTKWVRDTDGNWSCETMLVEDFDEPDATGLGALLDELRAVPGNRWQEMADPIAEYHKWNSDEEGNK